MLGDSGVSTTSLSIIGMEELYIHFHIELGNEFHAIKHFRGPMFQSLPELFC